MDIYPFILDFPIYLNIDFQEFLQFVVPCFGIPVFIFNFINLGLFLPPTTQIE
jgi:hypothetical protein